MNIFAMYSICLFFSKNVHHSGFQSKHCVLWVRRGRGGKERAYSFLIDLSDSYQPPLGFLFFTGITFLPTNYLTDCGYPAHTKQKHTGLEITFLI